MLELKNITKVFNPNTVNAKVALNGLNLTLNDGDFVTVIGGNGAGKSTMLNAIAGVCAPTRELSLLTATTSLTCPNINARPSSEEFSKTR